jgi:CheY-like chemotaxis protein
VHAILMDLHMPEVDGIEATRRLRAQPSTAHLPIIALTAAVLDAERAQAHAAGMNGFVSKPAGEGDAVDVRRRCGRLPARTAAMRPPERVDHADEAVQSPREGARDFDGQIARAQRSSANSVRARDRRDRRRHRHQRLSTFATAGARSRCGLGHVRAQQRRR